MPKRVDVDDYYAQLPSVALPHMERLRDLSLAASSSLVEQLAWNNPAYVLDGTRAWMLQSFKAHCSLRFTPEIFVAFAEEVAAAGAESGEGFVKLPFDQPLPEELLSSLMAQRLAQME
jgi:uncharacterized protein YdhG (YjbR/CyaY superfamily)